MAVVYFFLLACKRLIPLLVALLFGLALSGCGGKVELLASLPEADANEVIAALINEGIDAVKVPGKEGMVGIRVDQTQAAKAVDVLRAKGLPREQFVGMGQVFRKDGLISSPIEERARYLYALSQDLSATLSRIDGVLFARVHLVLPERGSGADQDTPSTAAVFMKHQADADIEILQPQVRRLVVNSIPGLSLDRVSVVLVPSAAKPPEALTPWEMVWGIQVHPMSASALQWLVAGLLLVMLALLGALGYLLWRFVWLPKRAAATGASVSSVAP
jgi:type III secretion protein J